LSDDFARVKEALSLKDVIMDATGFKVKGGHLEECPFCHKKKCFSIKGLGYHCFKCDEAGDVIIFFEKYNNMTRGQALEKCAGLAGIELKKASTSRAVEMTVKERIFRDAAAYYNEQAMSGPGRSYFIERRGHDERLLQDMQLGYADGRLKDHLLGLNYSIEDVVGVGLVQKVDKGNGKGPKVLYRDYFPKDVAIFPHFDARGRVLHFTQKDADPVRSKDPDKKVRWQLKKEHTDREWRFYNQKAMKGDSVILVEGENDLLAIMSAGHRNVMAIIGQISDVQLKALQDNMKHKDLYLWLDNDGVFDKGAEGSASEKRGKGGRGFTEKICKALKSASYGVRIIEHGGEAKDPDEHLRAISGNARQEVQRLIEGAITYVGWQLRRVGEMQDPHEIVKALEDRKMFATLAAMPSINRFPYIEILKGMGLTEEMISEAMEVNRELREALKAMGDLTKVNIHNVVSTIYEHFAANGKFFRDIKHNVYLLYQNHIYGIDNNTPFNALMARSGALLVNKAPGPQVWEGLRCKGFNEGTQIDIASWLATEDRRGCIYVNFNSPDNTILKISGAGIEEVPNGLNEDDVLLRASDKIRSMEFNQGVTIRDGLEVLRNLVLNNMTCDIEQRYLIICWMISAFLHDFMPYQALMKFSGESSSGKTTAAKLVSHVLYGQEVLGHVSSAAAFSMAAQNPLVILDNLEADNRGKAMQTFLLLASTGGTKDKRAGGTDSDTISEKPKSLVLITAIEPLEQAELINRTMDIEFRKSHRLDNFVESIVVRDIDKQRETIISAILKLLAADILPNMEEGIKENLKILKKVYRGHSKDRADEYLALLMLILEKILPHMPFRGLDDFTTKPADIWAEWINYQNQQARDDEIQSNSILRMLDGLAAAYVHEMRDGKYEQYPEQPGLHLMKDVKVFRYRHKLYMLEAEKTEPKQVTTGRDGKPCDPYYRSYLSFTMPSSELVVAMSAWCKEKGLRNPYDNAGRFTKRFQNDRETLRRGGWEIEEKESLKGPYSKITGGTRFITIRKTLER